MKFYLIGMPGSGKTTLGKRLANKLNFSFIDLDKLVEEHVGASVSSIFLYQGESYFRTVEREMLISTANFDRAIVACGGGTPCFSDNMEWINNHGISIYLEVELGILESRLKNNSSRPLLKNNSLEDLFQKRVSYYQQASIVEHTLEGILDKLNSMLPDMDAT